MKKTLNFYKRINNWFVISIILNMISLINLFVLVLGLRFFRYVEQFSFYHIYSAIIAVILIIAMVIFYFILKNRDKNKFPDLYINFKN